MKRALMFLIVACAALVLVYPATAPFAKSPDSKKPPTIQIITPHAGTDLADSGDDGDADDLAGSKDGKTKMNGASDRSDVMIRARLAAQMWRLYIFTFRLY
jgi:hypothetical protein